MPEDKVERFFDLVKSGDLEAVQAAITADSNILTSQDNEGNTAVDIAIANNASIIGRVTGFKDTSKVIEYLDKKQIELNIPARRTCDNFLAAVRDDDADEELVKQYLEQFPDIANKAKDAKGNTALHLAVEGTNLNLVELLIKEGYSDIYAKNNKGELAVDLTRDEMVWDRVVENHREGIGEYLENIDKKIKTLHQAYPANNKVTGNPKFIEELKSETGKSLAQLKKEKLKQLEEHNDSLSKLVTDLTNKNARINQQKIKVGAVEYTPEGLVDQNKTLDSKVTKLEAEHTEEKKARQNNEKEAIPQKIKRNLESDTLSDLLNEKASKKAKSSQTKLDLLVDGLSEKGNSEALASMLAKERFSAKLVDKVFGRKTDHDRAMRAIEKLQEGSVVSENDKKAALKELASFLTKERTSAKAAKWLTGKLFGKERKTDHDLAIETIENVRKAIENVKKDVDSHRDPIKKVSRWEKKSASKTI